MKIFTVIISILIAVSMMKAQSKPEMEKLLWIIDKWVSSNDESSSYEEWNRINDTLFEGSSKTVKDGKIIFEEKLKIIEENGDIFYVADVKHNPAPVYFRLTYSEANIAVFENPEHDFPKKVTYKHEEGTLHATIEGPSKKGDWKKVDFYFNKIR
jgi:hypothetical protein